MAFLPQKAEQKGVLYVFSQISFEIFEKFMRISEIFKITPLRRNCFALGYFAQKRED